MPLVALVVDDSMLIRHTVCRFLEERGFIVESASNGQDALEVLKHMHPDLIVTDMEMPKMGGSEFISGPEKPASTAQIPVISWPASRVVSKIRKIEPISPSLKILISRLSWPKRCRP